MSLRPTFINALKAAIQADFLALYAKPCIIPEQELLRFVNSRGFNNLYDAQAYFKRVLHYYSQKYKFVPTFKHLTSDKLPVFREMADWERAVYRKYPSFQPVIFLPTKSSLSMDYALAEGLLASADTIQFAADFATDLMYCPDLRYIPRAVELLERAVFSLEYRNANAPHAIANILVAHARLVALRVPYRDTNSGWLKQHFAYACLRRLMFKTELFGYQYIWDALKYLLDNNQSLSGWIGFANSMRKYAKYVVTDNPLVLTKVQYAQAYSMCPEVMVYYPYEAV